MITSTIQNGGLLNLLTEFKSRPIQNIEFDSQITQLVGYHCHDQWYAVEVELVKREDEMVYCQGFGYETVGRSKDWGLLLRGRTVPLSANASFSRLLGGHGHVSVSSKWLI